MTTARLPLPRLLGDRVFYGWVVVAAVFVMLTTTAGLGFYNATVYLRALTQQQGFSLEAAAGRRRCSSCPAARLGCRPPGCSRASTRG